MAGPTGLEPATSGVTGRHSNQLNYGPATIFSYYGRPEDLADLGFRSGFGMVGGGGFEPTTPCV